MPFATVSCLPHPSWLCVHIWHIIHIYNIRKYRNQNLHRKPELGQLVSDGTIRCADVTYWIWMSTKKKIFCFKNFVYVSCLSTSSDNGKSRCGFTQSTLHILLRDVHADALNTQVVWIIVREIRNSAKNFTPFLYFHVSDL